MNQVRRRVLRPAPEVSPDPALARRYDRQRQQLADRSPIPSPLDNQAQTSL